jgi:hypothetical protein
MPQPVSGKGQRRADPTPADIAARAREIRAEWRGRETAARDRGFCVALERGRNLRPVSKCSAEE